MIERKVKIVNRLGLHARAAASLVKTASHYHSCIKLFRTDKLVPADAKSILSVLLLAASRGTELTMSVDGTDELEAAEALSSLFAEGFGESAQ